MAHKSGSTTRLLKDKALREGVRRIAFLEQSVDN